MPDQVTDRPSTSGLIPEEISSEILTAAAQESIALSAFNQKRLRTKQQRIRIAEVFPEADWVSELTNDNLDSDDHKKPVTSMEFGSRYITVEPLAAIVVIPEEVIEDIRDGAGIDIWSEIRPQLSTACAQRIDAAVMFGTPGAGTRPWRSPSTFPEGIEVQARAAGNVVSAAGSPDLAEAVNQAWGLVEADGFDVNIQLSSRLLRKELRGMRDDNGQPLFVDQLRSAEGPPELYGQRFQYVTNGSWREAQAAGGPGAKILLGDGSCVWVALRTDLEYKVLDQASVEINGVTVNLAQSDSVALRVRMRAGFQVVVPPTWETDAPNRFPFAVVEP